MVDGKPSIWIFFLFSLSISLKFLFIRWYHCSRSTGILVGFFSLFLIDWCDQVSSRVHLDVVYTWIHRIVRLSFIYRWSSFGILVFDIYMVKNIWIDWYTIYYPAQAKIHASSLGPSCVNFDILFLRFRWSTRNSQMDGMLIVILLHVWLSF